MSLTAPLAFRAVYQELVWGGRRMERWRDDLPAGPIGESWDLSDHARGQSVVAGGPLADATLGEITRRFGADLVGRGFRGGPFPLLVKLIDADDNLSVQVHPDDAAARRLGLGDGGKTECWLMLEDGGDVYQGTRPGVDRAVFEQALAAGRLGDTLNRFSARAGDFYFLEARTVHALGSGCLLYEIQQTSDLTLRVYDWGRVGLGGKPRPLHVRESLDTIAFERGGFGPQRPEWARAPEGGLRRVLAECDVFRVEERRVSAGETARIALGGTCAAVTGISGEGRVACPGGDLPIAPARTLLVPAAAGSWILEGLPGPIDVLVAAPVLPGAGA